MILEHKQHESVVSMMHQSGFRIFISYLQELEDRKIEQMLNCKKEETVRDKAQYIKAIRDISQFFRMCETQIREHTEQV